MSTRKLAQHLQNDVSKPLPGQVPNSTGGFVWSIGDWQRLERFLILGSDGGSYYASERALTVQNAAVVMRLAKQDGLRVVKTVLEISKQNRAPKNDPAVLALAICQKHGDEATKLAVRQAILEICRTPTHLFGFAAAIKAQKGWGPSVQKTISRYYLDTPLEKLAYHAIKYQSRDGWSHRDLLRLCHIRPPSEAAGALYRYMVKGLEGELGDAPAGATKLIWAAEKAKRASTSEELVGLILDFGLPREAIPTQFLNAPAVWEALLYAAGGMPATALLRNLGKLSSIGLLTAGSKTEELVVSRLSDPQLAQKARIHPLAALVALRTYASGHGVRGDLAWKPVDTVVAALDKLFYAAFGAITPANKRWLLGLDVSGSMTCGTIAGLPGITPRVGTAAMAMVAMRTEASVESVGFCHTLVPLGFKPTMNLEQVCKIMDNLPFGATNVGLVLEHAIREKIPVDVFSIYTDNEVNQGSHVASLLQKYRDVMGIPARLVMVGMIANDFTVGDPNDSGTLNVVGFDTAVPELMNSFARGEL
jgi:60 kDa SS-A/Ro ribonucleoprotein